MKGRQREAANPIRGHWIFPYRPQWERRVKQRLGNKERRREETRGGEKKQGERMGDKKRRGEERRRGKERK